MKKFSICLFILLVFAGFVFYLGYTTLKVDAEKIGVVYSKTSGICQEPVVPGKFSWHWEFLLPTNAKIKQFELKPVNVNKSISGQLPSGEVYTAIYATTDTFNYNFDFSISLTISPENIISLLEQNKISDQKDLETFMSNAADTIAQLSADYYLTKAKENPYFSLEKIRRDDVIRAIQVYKEYPEIDITSFALINSKIPDFNLYRKLQNTTLYSQESGDQNE